MNFGLLRLAFRRSLPPFALGVWAVLLALLLSRRWIGESSRLDALVSGIDPDALARGVARAGTWTALALAFAPLLVARAAHTIPGWRNGEGEWLGSRAAGRGVILVSTWLGTCLGALALFLCTGLAIEARLGSGGTSLQRAGTIPLPPTSRSSWIAPGAPLSWSAPDPGDGAPEGSRARVEIGFAAGSASAVEVVFRARRERADARREHADAGRESTDARRESADARRESADARGERADSRQSEARARIAGRGPIEVEVPRGPGALHFELDCAGEGSRAAVVSQVVELWAPCASERAASVRILASIAAALVAWSGLAIGLAAWASASTVTLALLATWLAAWLGESAPPWWPGADLCAALATAASGRVPSMPDPRSFATAAVLAALGLAVGAAGLRRWRTP